MFCIRANKKVRLLHIVKKKKVKGIYAYVYVYIVTEEKIYFDLLFSCASIELRKEFFNLNNNAIQPDYN